MKKTNLIIFPGNFLPHVGGLETHVDEFCKYLSKTNKYNITIFVPNVVGAKEKETIHNKVKVIRYPAFELVSNWPFPKLWSFKFWKLYFELYKNKYDIVMTRTMFFTNSTLGLFFSKFRFKKNRIKLVHVEHASDYSKLDSKFKLFMNKFYMKTFGKLLFIFSNKVVAISDATKEFLNKEFMKDVSNVPVVRRGFDYKSIEKINPNEEIKKEYKNKKIITFVGRLIDGKGVQDVIKALKTFDENYIFLIIGDGNYKQKLEELVKENNLQNKVVFLGKMEHSDVLSILKISDVFVNPSYTEGLPTAVLDALFCECKIMATDVGGTYEILSENWNTKRYKLVKMKDIDAIRSSIEILLKEKSKVDINLIHEIKKKFDWQNHAKIYDKIISEILK